MDRSFLSQPNVIAASRNFVCIRLTTYEDDEEAKFSKYVFAPPGGGGIQNTTFALMAPDGKTKLTRAGRGTRGIFTDPADMAKQMNTIAEKYPADPKAKDTPALPVTLTAKLGVDVAAADGLLLVAVLAKEDKTRNELSATLAKLAWSERFLGKFTYCTAKEVSDFPKIEGLKANDGFVLIAPDQFGMSGKVISQLPADSSSEAISKALTTAWAEHAKKAAKGQREHRDAGIAAGAFWVPKLPVTDKQEENARSGAKQAIEARKKQ